MIYPNGSGEGILWQVVATKGIWIRIKPAHTLTGASSLNAKRVTYGSVTGVSLVQLCDMRQQFDEFIQGIVRQRSSEEFSTDPFEQPHEGQT